MTPIRILFLAGLALAGALTSTLEVHAKGDFILHCRQSSGFGALPLNLVRLP